MSAEVFGLAYLVVALVAWRRIYLWAYRDFSPTGWDNHDRFWCSVGSTLGASVWPLVALFPLLARGLARLEKAGQP